jgi:hypothetical protein
MQIRSLFIILFFLLVTHNISAQQFYGGLMGGFNSTQVEGDTGSGYNKLGLAAGMWMQNDFANMAFWGMEIKYTQKGSRIKGNHLLGIEKFVGRLNYVELPVFVGLSYQYLSAYAGVSYAHIVNQNNTDALGMKVNYPSITNWETAGLAGLKINFDKLVRKHWAKKFVFDARIQYSLLSIDKQHDFFWDRYSTGQFNNVISFMLHYKI